MLGHDWHESIQVAIRDCDFGLLLVSPTFLGSEYILKNELPHFVGAAGDSTKPVIPAGLIPVDFVNHDLHGLNCSEIFLLNGHFFAEMRGSQKQRAFVHQLYAKTEVRLNAWFS